MTFFSFHVFEGAKVECYSIVREVDLRNPEFFNIRLLFKLRR